MQTHPKPLPASPIVPEREAGSARPLSVSALSVHLDAVRGIAALLVFLEHFRNLFFQDYGGLTRHGALMKLLYFVTVLGHEAVMVFFVLSGYFITASTVRAVKEGRWSWQWYAEQRLTRLYAVLIPALCLGGLLDHLGMRLFGQGTIYSAPAQYHYMIAAPVAANTAAHIALGNLFFLQGIRVPTYGSNGALWSLSYEAWYYVIFPLLFLALSARRTVVTRALSAAGAALALAFVGREIDLYFLIWLMGAALVFAKPVSWKRPAVLAARAVTFLAFMAAIAAERVQVIRDVRAADFAIGICFTAFLYFLTASAADRKAGDGVYARTASLLSGTSYSLYLLHTPMLVFLNALLIRQAPRWQPDGPHLLMACGVAAAVLAYVGVVWSLTEAKTPQIRRLARTWPVRVFSAARRSDRRG